MSNNRNLGHEFAATGSTAGLSQGGLLEGDQMMYMQGADRNGQYPQASILRSLEKKGRGRH